VENPEDHLPGEKSQEVLTTSQLPGERGQPSGDPGQPGRRPPGRPPRGRPTEKPPRRHTGSQLKLTEDTLERSEEEDHTVFSMPTTCHLITTTQEDGILHYIEKPTLTVMDITFTIKSTVTMLTLQMQL